MNENTEKTTRETEGDGYKKDPFFEDLLDLRLCEIDDDCFERIMLELIADAQKRYLIKETKVNFLSEKLIAALGSAKAKLGEIENQKKTLSELFFSHLTQNATLVEEQVGFFIIDLVKDAMKSKIERQRIAKGSGKDSLTGVENRGEFNQYLNQLINSERKDEKDFCLIFIDFDDFKEVNAGHGHPAGDTVLKRAARKIEEVSRPNDRVFRYGGDEFAVIATNTNFKGGEILQKRVVEALNSLEIQVPVSSETTKQATVAVKVSAGLAFYDRKKKPSAEAFILSADQGMYGEKNRKKRKSSQ